MQYIFEGPLLESVEHNASGWENIANKEFDVDNSDINKRGVKEQFILTDKEDPNPDIKTVNWHKVKDLDSKIVLEGTAKWEINNKSLPVVNERRAIVLNLRIGIIRQHQEHNSKEVPHVSRRVHANEWKDIDTEVAIWSALLLVQFWLGSVQDSEGGEWDGEVCDDECVSAYLS